MQQINHQITVGQGFSMWPVGIQRICFGQVSWISRCYSILINVSSICSQQNDTHPLKEQGLSTRLSANCSQPYLLKFRFNSTSATISHRELTITTNGPKTLISVLVFRLALHLNAYSGDM